MREPDTDICTIQSKAREIRRLVLESVHRAGAGHIGGPLSAADLLATLYFGVLRIDPQRPNWPDRDRFILSKGHSAIGWYAALALRGYFPIEELSTFDALDSRLQGHPDMTITPGVDMSTGSLGQGLSAGLGMALGARLAGKGFHTWVIIGDGELQEGQVWEAIQVAPRYKLGNLTAILDHNKLSQFGWTHAPEGYGGLHREPPIVDPGEKIGLFGWNVVQIDGHNVEEILAACTLARHAGERPTLIVAHTTKGKGVGYMEGNFRWHTGPMTEEQIAEALAGFAESNG